MIRLSPLQPSALLAFFLLFSQSTYAQCQISKPSNRTNKGGLLSWEKDRDQAFKKAKEQKKPILMFFTADW